MIAFWKYDQFPFVLSGTVTGYEVGYDNNERVITQEYGMGSLFKPIIIFPDIKGKEIQAHLKSIEEEYDRDIADLKDRYAEKVKAVFPFNTF